METESDGKIPFLDVLVIRKGSALTTKVYRKPIQTGCYLHFDYSHPPHVKKRFSLELLLYARNKKTYLMKLTS
jgi:hypothetical protein